MKKLIFITLLSTLCLAISCSKTTDEIKVESKLLGKWTLKNWTGNDLIGTQNRASSGNFAPGEYMLFESAGMFTILVDSKITKSYYKLLDDNKTLFIAPNGGIDVPDDGYQIKSLTDHNLVLYWKELTGSTIVSDVTVYLER